MTYEFQFTLFRTAYEMLDAVAYEHLSAGGLNDRNTMLQLLSDFTDEELADECIESYGLDQPVYDDNSPLWMEARGVDRADLVKAFQCGRRSWLLPLQPL